jgi:thiol-disulfide isomerase/thioredoxin
VAELVLYHRYGCHLCDDMLEQLQLLQRSRPFQFTLVDVDADRRLSAIYNDRVPTLEADGREICRYFLDLDKLEAVLG